MTVNALKIKSGLICIMVASLLLGAFTQNAHAEATASATSTDRCVQRDGLSFKGIGLWSRLPKVLERFGPPSRIEPIPGGPDKTRVNARYYYKDIELIISNSTVWRINVLTPTFTIQSGIRLNDEFARVENSLGMKLDNPVTDQKNLFLYKKPICPPEPPEVEEYVILRFDNKKSLKGFIVQAVFP